ncbi:TPA: decarboxylating 6-phosphogluconate dehydrogenase [Candidatus Dependentiae bacterium]|nr:MAG: 6-phosphogluconate dehydrogenase, decarboxylating [candidate division TM6 bacterium GW2011_GWE2_31_21]KKP54147.1 MAG: 6-phosphogluconate dehydrogenase, decarboxylating [candidate division TM6 bacterium GW2011_GWF2_33_332]HBS47868.1 decarboxylating 6-phosphogluconate dehydrogenase [Candidatus Dependentiae bacterium]HBZ73053.1 decarboxylating 6-phosphogluconate dehydrogenase [Candidatus Dependentiae bacterium]
MKIGLIGLGRMGSAIAYRLQKANINILAFDPSENAKNIAAELKIEFSSKIEAISQKVDIIWLMVPAGKIVDETIEKLLPHLKKDSIIIDGGNSNFEDSIRRYNFLKKHQINFVDCGTSGGLHGRENGFSLMVGGDQNIFEKLKPIFQAITAKNGYEHIGPAGAGHYVKMVHNGIEYALLQAYGEGFNLLKNGHYKNLDLEKIASVWNHGSIIRSWILNLSVEIFKEDQELKNISGEIGENLTGRWTEQEAEKQNIPLDLIKKSLDIREWSRKSGGNYATKVVAMLRNKFGGHEVKKQDK